MAFIEVQDVLFGGGVKVIAVPVLLWPSRIDRVLGAGWRRRPKRSGQCPIQIIGAVQTSLPED